MWTTLDRAVNIYCCLYWVYVLIRHYLITGRKYGLTKIYVLNKLVRLSDFTVMYGTIWHIVHKQSHAQVALRKSKKGSGQCPQIKEINAIFETQVSINKKAHWDFCHVISFRAN